MELTTKEEKTILDALRWYQNGLAKGEIKDAVLDLEEIDTLYETINNFRVVLQEI